MLHLFSLCPSRLYLAPVCCRPLYRSVALFTWPGYTSGGSGWSDTLRQCVCMVWQGGDPAVTCVALPYSIRMTAGGFVGLRPHQWHTSRCGGTQRCVAQHQRVWYTPVYPYTDTGVRVSVSI